MEAQIPPVVQREYSSMACQRCHWYSGRRVDTGGGVGLGHCKMAAAAANRLPFDGVVVQCAQCNRSGCLNCVESLSKELSAWLNSGNGMGYSIAAQDNLESCMWNDILMLPSTPLSGRTWSYRDESLIVFKKLPCCHTNISTPEQRAPLVRSPSPSHPIPSLSHPIPCSHAPTAHVLASGVFVGYRR